jgi:hypothetical protein
MNALVSYGAQGGAVRRWSWVFCVLHSRRAQLCCSAGATGVQLPQQCFCGIACGPREACGARSGEWHGGRVAGA